MKDPDHPFFGKTGEFPKGKLNDTDEGGLQFGIAHANGNVIFDFGTPVKWMAFPPQTARQIAKTLIEHADAIEAKS